MAYASAKRKIEIQLILEEDEVQYLIELTRNYLDLNQKESISDKNIRTSIFTTLSNAKNS